VLDLLAAGRRILGEILTDRDGLLAELQARISASENGVEGDLSGSR
jgi:ArsR family transcriptional regulator